LGKGVARARIEATRNGARPSPFTSHYLQQARGTKTGNGIDYLHWLTLENPARHRNPQCRISQMPEFHRITPHARTFYWGETTKVPSSTNPNSAPSAGLGHEGAMNWEE